MSAYFSPNHSLPELSKSTRNMGDRGTSAPSRSSEVLDLLGLIGLRQMLVDSFKKWLNSPVGNSEEPFDSMIAAKEGIVRRIKGCGGARGKLDQPFTSFSDPPIYKPRVNSIARIQIGEEITELKYSSEKM